MVWFLTYYFYERQEKKNSRSDFLVLVISSATKQKPLIPLTHVLVDE